MATSSTTTAGSAPTTGAEPTRAGRRAAWALAVALLAVAVAFGVTVVRMLSDLDNSFRFGGDQAMTGLAVDEAQGLDRRLGPYSRYGWSHPGPFWFYLLAPVARLLGDDDAALAAAVVLVNGVLAAAVVLAVHRAARPSLAPAAAALVLVFLLRPPTTWFLDVWSPYALLLGTLLFLALAVRVPSGSWPVLLSMLVAGSFLVQTHVGSAPLVLLVGATAGVGFVLAQRTRRAAVEPGADDAAGAARSRFGWRTVVPAVLLVAVWLPPLVEQLSSPLREGNLARLVSFFLHHEGEGGDPTFPQAVVAVGRLLAVPMYGWDPGPYEMDLDGLPLSVALALVIQAVVSVILVVLGRRWGSRAGLWWGAITLAALAAAIAAAATVTGPLYWYLLTWVAAVPVATAIGVVHLALDAVAGHGAEPDRRSALDRVPVLVGLAVVALVASAGATGTLGGAIDDLPASGEVAAATQLVEEGLAGVGGRSVHLEMDPHELWPLGAGVVRGLVSDGWEVTVEPEFSELFGAGRTDADGGSVDVLLVTTDGAAHQQWRAEPGVREAGALETPFGWVTVLVRTAG